MKVSTLVDLSVRRVARIVEPIGFIATGKPTPSAALVVASSSRSGSTWLADMMSLTLRLQQVFEPLHPKHNAAVRRLTGFDPNQDHAYYLRASDAYPDWNRLLQAILTGKIRSHWTDAVPTIWFPQGYLIKMIRANLMLGYISDQFHPKLIYLVRHPCAVVHSRLKMGWTTNAGAFLAQENLVEDYLQPWVSQIEREDNVVGSHALGWAIENLVAQRELSTRPHYRIFYEHLIMDTAQETRRITDYVGLKASEIPEGVIEHSSRTSHRFAIQAPVDRLVSWKKGLSQEDQFRVLDWANRLGISWYNMEPMPNDSSGRRSPPSDSAMDVSMTVPSVERLQCVC